MKTVTINVTRADIIHGIVKAPSACPIARAARRRFRCPVYVGPRGMDVYRFTREESQTIRMPANAIRFVRRFDNHQAVKPFAFKIKI